MIAGVQLNLSESQACFESDSLDRSSGGFGEHDIESSDSLVEIHRILRGSLKAGGYQPGRQFEFAIVGSLGDPDGLVDEETSFGWAALHGQSLGLDQIRHGCVALCFCFLEDVGGALKIDEGVLWPKGLAELVACNQFSRMGEEECQELEGLLLEFDLDSELAQLRRPQINFKYAETPSAERTRPGMHVTPLQWRRDRKRSI